MPKKAKKGKGKKEAGPEVLTTRTIVRERERACCPRLGDATLRQERADEIMMECVFFKIRRAVLRDKDELDLSRSNLAAMPDDMRMPELGNLLIKLDLSHNQLFGSQHVFDVCSGLRQLTDLDLSYNFLNGPLSAAACLNFPQLEVLCLDGNQITALPDDVGSWRKLRKFSASKNALRTLPAQACNGWIALTHLNLRNNALQTLPTMGEAWANLEVLYLGSNELKELPSVESLVSLRELDLRSNQLAALPPFLACCTGLIKLHLGNNKITDVPPEVLGSLVNVEELHLYKNKLDQLPDELGNLTKCRMLTLSSNNLRTLPDSIDQCKSLAELYINNCAKFASLPASAGDCTALRELQAKKCPGLKALPATAAAWENLRELDLRAAKKQVCKLPPEVTAALEARQCTIRGGVQKKAKAGKKGKK
ncbi:hypothetical protein M885DRAFT_456412 [Pelagophyceae sp. CCMP2097]|nr:hypothetical protein M885DRAFT_456412 [Pelagophyceae sp. CCMP2097]